MGLSRAYVGEKVVARLAVRLAQSLQLSLLPSSVKCECNTLLVLTVGFGHWMAGHIALAG